MGLSTGLLIHIRVSSETQFTWCEPTIQCFRAADLTQCSAWQLRHIYDKSHLRPIHTYKPVATDPVCCLPEWVTKQSSAKWFLDLFHGCVVQYITFWWYFIKLSEDIFTFRSLCYIKLACNGKFFVVVFWPFGVRTSQNQYGLLKLIWLMC